MQPPMPTHDNKRRGHILTTNYIFLMTSTNSLILHSTIREIITVPECHVIEVLIAGNIAPCLAKCDRVLAIIIFQVFTLGLYKMILPLLVITVMLGYWLI